MQNIDTGHLIYLIVLGVAVVFWFFASNREKISTVTQQAMIWGLIFIGVIAAVGLWGDVRDTVLPSQSFNGSNQIEIPSNVDGHFYITANVNGAPITFVVDTGASEIVLSQADAATAGLDVENLAYTGRAFTANGEVRTAPVRLDLFAIGSIEDQRLRAVVNEGELEQSLLGMTYLNRYSSIEIKNGTLLLTR